MARFCGFFNVLCGTPTVGGLGRSLSPVSGRCLRLHELSAQPMCKHFAKQWHIPAVCQLGVCLTRQASKLMETIVSNGAGGCFQAHGSPQLIVSSEKLFSHPGFACTDRSCFHLLDDRDVTKTTIFYQEGSFGVLQRMYDFPGRYYTQTQETVFVLL